MTSQRTASRRSLSDSLETAEPPAPPRPAPIGAFIERRPGRVSAADAAAPRQIAKCSSKADTTTFVKSFVCVVITSRCSLQLNSYRPSAATDDGARAAGHARRDCRYQRVETHYYGYAFSTPFSAGRARLANTAGAVIYFSGAHSSHEPITADIRRFRLSFPMLDSRHGMYEFRKTLAARAHADDLPLE